MVSSSSSSCFSNVMPNYDYSLSEDHVTGMGEPLYVKRPAKRPVITESPDATSAKKRSPPSSSSSSALSNTPLMALQIAASPPEEVGGGVFNGPEPIIGNGCIYIFVNTANGKKYVGQTWNIKRRIRDHLNGRGYAKLLAAALNKYGRSGFKIDVLVSNIHTQEELDHEEVEAISKYSTLCPGGYNIKEGGSGGRHSEATKLLIGDQHRGKDVSQETRTKLRLSNVGKTMSKDARSRIAIGMRAYNRDLDKPVYFFDAYTHEIIRMFKNMTEIRSHISFPSKRVTNSICHEWAFRYEKKRCYARHTDRPLEKSFQAGRRQVLVTFLDTTQEPMIFSSTADATRELHIGRGVIDCLVRKKYKKSKCIYQGKFVYFTASYYEAATTMVR